ncbi:hypothetical protein NDU88_004226 [Pleurodeles waltl]|uniref:Uncharacterized protein n=1 Tax=Pleurodeles waltl TaxID=8319 RepID=A0AAV7NIZ1_PLEWA|nr:hypothetical protein NDU88_004226 [Pleurodeles waltl]
MMMIRATQQKTHQGASHGDVAMDVVAEVPSEVALQAVIQGFWVALEDKIQTDNGDRGGTHSAREPLNGNKGLAGVTEAGAVTRGPKSQRPLARTLLAAPLGQNLLFPFFLKRNV